MDYAALKTEVDVTGHPVTGPYPADNDAAAAAIMALNIDVDKSILTGDEMFKATDSTDWTDLTDHKQVLWVSFCTKDIDPFDPANVAFVTWLFGAGKPTLTNLNNARKTQISRAQQIADILKWTKPIDGTHIATARAQ